MCSAFAGSARERGQTLILGVLAIIALLIATLIIFDLSSVIRTKLRSQTAVDAASLAAANWQIESLNLIGELNLVKACTALVSDIPPFGDDSPEGLVSSNDLLTQMQARIAFVGPLIGFGAAQQAAKNNHMTSDSHYTKVVVSHMNRILDDNYYGEDVGVRQQIQGYFWRMPYYSMLYDICVEGGGIAVAPNAEFAGIPDVKPAWLMDLSLYDAISAGYWCHKTLRELLKNFSFEGKWWNVEISQDRADFTEESEYLTLYTEFSQAGDSFTRDQALASLEQIASGRGLELSDEYNRSDIADTDGINSPLPYLKWCLYESCWKDDLPAMEWIDGSYLRSPLRPEYIYGGALSRMRSDIQIKRQSGAYSFNSLKGKKLMRRSDQSSIYSKASALAKPLGSLGNGLPPYITGMVLPVFEKARLIPVAMQGPDNLYDPFDSRLYDLYNFLLWLDEVEDLDNPPSQPPAGGAYFLACLRKLNNETWRSLGYNRSYVDTGKYPTDAYDASSNPTGAGWLQMGRRYEYDASGDPISVIDRNEDGCSDWPGGGPGRRYGPPVLH